MRVRKEFIVGVIFGVALTFLFTTDVTTRKLYASGGYLQLLSKARNIPSPHLQDDDREARRQAQDVRVLIWVMTQPKNHNYKVKAVQDTWGRRANRLLFFSSQANDSIPTIGLNVTEGRNHTTMKCQAAWQYVYRHYLHQADWFMKADDDTYVIVENLRHFLSGENSSDPVFFGHHFRTLTNGGYFSGGGGYVVSKAALQRYGEKGPEIFTLCQQDGQGEDWKWSECMNKLGVRMGNSTDALGRTRFHCFDPQKHLAGQYPAWYYNYRHHVGKGVDSISDYAVSFHYVSPPMMQALEFYLYHLAPYGIVKGRQNLNTQRAQSGASGR